MTRRELIQFSLAAPCAAAGATRLDRRAIVRRHNPVVTKFDAGSSLSVGNGSFAFTVDCTGLQSVPKPYLDGVPLATQAEWAWHSMANPSGYRYEDAFEELKTRTGRTVRYPSRWRTPAGLWFRETPYKLGLAEIGFVPREGPLRTEDCGDIRQELDLWEGAIRSRFLCQGKPVETVTVCHPERDAIAVRIVFSALSAGGLRVRFAFPFTSSIYPWTSSPFSPNNKGFADAKTRGEKWAVTVVSQDARELVIRHSADADHYFATLRFSPGASIEHSGDEAFLLASQSRTLEFTIEFTPDAPANARLDVKDAIRRATSYWSSFWSGGACLDLSGSTDTRAGELERRAVLSQYLTAIQCSGRMPPQETGLSGNSWYGKFHAEMHWWHAAHFPLWGRASLLERSLAWYRDVMPRARAYAAAQGYRGVRWPKECGPEGRVNPSDIGPFLIWQQPHPIYFAELLYRENPERSTLARYAEMVHESAEFMASFAELDPAGQYFLGPPVIPAQETYPYQQTWNPTYELSYWAWGLKVAQRWRERQNLPRVAAWDHVAEHLSPLPVRDGVYLGAESQPDMWESNRKDHPSFLAALGVLPGDLVDRDTMRRTLHRTLDRWDWQQTWGWDYPMIAMTATRLEEPELAIRSLMMDVPRNRYTLNGHCNQRRFLAGYLPGNGGLLAALALMAAGWDGGRRDTPGFPKDGKWQVKTEALRPLL